MTWLDTARARLRLLLARHAAESRFNREFGLHIERETEKLMREHGWNSAFVTEAVSPWNRVMKWLPRAVTRQARRSESGP